MKVKTIFIIWIVAMLFIALGFVLIPTSIEEPNYVSGDNHIYRGQELDPRWHIQWAGLSARGSWLDSTQYINRAMKSDLEAMILEAEKDGYCIVVMSAYRNPEKQQVLYDLAEDKSIVALPMESEHQTGLAIDITGCPMNKDGVRDDALERLELTKPFNELVYPLVIQDVLSSSIYQWI